MDKIKIYYKIKEKILQYTIFTKKFGHKLLIINL